MSTKPALHFLMITLAVLVLAGCPGISKPGDEEYSGAWIAISCELLEDEFSPAYAHDLLLDPPVPVESCLPTTDPPPGKAPSLRCVHFARLGRTLADDQTLLDPAAIREMLEPHLGVPVEVESFVNSIPGDGQTLSYRASWLQNGEVPSSLEVTESSHLEKSDDTVRIVTVIRHVYRREGLAFDIDHVRLTFKPLE